MTKPSKESEKKERDNLSWGAVVSRDTLGNLTIPPNSLNHFFSHVNEPYMLVIYNPQKNSLKVEVFPVNTKIIYKLQLVLTAFSQEIFQQISKILRDLDIERLFTSGVCLKEGLCIYEAYIEETRLKMGKDKVLTMFSEIPNIKEVLLDQL